MASPSTSRSASEEVDDIESMPIEKMDKDDLVLWLLEKGIPLDYCKIFEGSY